MKLSVDDFLGAVNTWGHNNKARVGNVWPLDGGWEWWAQAELAGYINSLDPASSALREVPAYNNGSLRADLVLNSTIPEIASSDVIVVELKCETVKSSMNFVNDVTEDIAKITTNSLKFAGCKKLVVGFFFSGYNHDKMVKDRRWAGSIISIFDGMFGAVAIKLS